MIFWNFGIHKIQIINFFLKISILLMFVQIIFTSFVVPISQDHARSLIRTSKVNFFGNFVKPQKFNDTIKKVIGKNLETPRHLKFIMDKEEKFDIINNSKSEVKDYILAKTQ